MPTTRIRYTIKSNQWFYDIDSAQKLKVLQFLIGFPNSAKISVSKNKLVFCMENLILFWTTFTKVQLFLGKTKESVTFTSHVIWFILRISTFQFISKSKIRNNFISG